MAVSFQVSTPGRILLGLSMIVLGIFLMVISLRFEWGVWVTTFVPGLVLQVPGVGLLRRCSLSYTDGTLSRRAGLFRQTEERIPLADAAIEVLPTAGARAVLIHVDGHEVPLATWISAGRARQLMTWLGEVHGQALPERERAKAQWDK